MQQAAGRMTSGSLRERPPPREGLLGGSAEAVRDWDHTPLSSLQPRASCCQLPARDLPHCIYQGSTHRSRFRGGSPLELSRLKTVGPSFSSPRPAPHTHTPALAVGYSEDPPSKDTPTITHLLFARPVALRALFFNSDPRGMHSCFSRLTAEKTEAGGELLSDLARARGQGWKNQVLGLDQKLHSPLS